MKENRKNTAGFPEFILQVKESLKSRLGDDTYVSWHTVTKNNGSKREGITIGKKGVRMTCSLYLEVPYKEYLQGVPLSEIIKKIENAYYRADKKELPEPDFLEDYQRIKKKIFYRLVNFRKNKEMLEEMPYLPFLDLAITFHCLVETSGEHIGSLPVTKQHLEQWEINLRTLTEQAKTNTPLLFPAKINTMAEVMLGFTDAGSSGFPDTAKLTEEPDIREIEQQMYVITNTMGINGAGCLLYKETVGKLAEQLKGNLYILPSSIHELIAVRDTVATNKTELARMVKEVNMSQVAEEDYLSDSVYYYCRDSQSIRKA